MSFVKLLISSIWTMAVLYRTDTLPSIRTDYAKTLADRELCAKMINELVEANSPSATNRAYLGGLQTIWANHLLSPINKLNTFRKGKKNIEQAITQDPDNAELRYIRLSVQLHAPAFLAYRAHIDEDIAFLRTNRQRIESPVVRAHVDKLLSTRKP